jgi:hypothetical protein
LARNIPSCILISHIDKHLTGPVVCKYKVLSFIPDMLLVLIPEIGFLDRGLAGTRVQVECPSLATRLRRGFTLEEGDIDVVDVQDACEGEAGRACAYDGDTRAGLSGGHIQVRNFSTSEVGDCAVL